MRELKFRAYHKKHKRMFPVYSLGKDFVMEDTLNGVDPGVNAFSRDDFFENIVVMQYTGLKDKNGIEIYEGDIVSTNSTKYDVSFVVSFKDGVFCIGRDDLPYGNFGNYATIRGTMEEAIKNGLQLIMKVVGNIYENPGLLKD